MKTLSERFDRELDRLTIERQEGWRELIDKIPFISFPNEWAVKVMPPFGGAVGRFSVKLPSGLTKSIYLDWWDRLGCYGEPYWEVHPYRGDVGRCAVQDVAKLLELIGNTEDGHND